MGLDWKEYLNIWERSNIHRKLTKAGIRPIKEAVLEEGMKYQQIGISQEQTGTVFRNTEIPNK